MCFLWMCNKSNQSFELFTQSPKQRISAKTPTASSTTIKCPMCATCWNLWHVAYKSKHVPLSLYIIFQFKAEINNSRNNKALHETPSAHAPLAQHRGNRVPDGLKNSHKCCGPSASRRPAAQEPSVEAPAGSVHEESCAVNISTGLCYTAAGGGDLLTSPPSTLNHMSCLLVVPLDICASCGAVSRFSWRSWRWERSWTTTWSRGFGFACFDPCRIKGVYMIP